MGNDLDATWAPSNRGSKAIIDEMHTFIDGRKIDALLNPSPTVYSKTININYPGFLDWLETVDVIRHHGTLREKVNRYTLLKAGYDSSISTKLNKLRTLLVGKAVMDEIDRASHSLTIIPQEFDGTIGGETKALGDPDGAAQTPAGEPV